MGTRGIYSGLGGMHMHHNQDQSQRLGRLTQHRNGSRLVQKHYSRVQSKRQRLKRFLVLAAITQVAFRVDLAHPTSMDQAMGERSTRRQFPPQS